MNTSDDMQGKKVPTRSLNNNFPSPLKHSV
jgi:hypothetical protein